MQECGAVLLELDGRKGQSPLPGGETRRTGCVICDDFLSSLCEVQHARVFVRRAGGRRGRARGDPLLSFRH